MALDESRRTERAGATTAGEITDCCWRRNQKHQSSAAPRRSSINMLRERPAPPMNWFSILVCAYLWLVVRSQRAA